MSRERTFVRRVRLGAPASEVFRWHERPGAFQRMNPPWERVKVLRQSGGIRDGASVEIETRLGPIAQTWRLRHEGYEPDTAFEDVLVDGPFPHWRHRHAVESSAAPTTSPGAESGEPGAVLEDRIEYRMPFGPLGDIFGRGFVTDRLERMFAYRHQVLQQDLERHRSAVGASTMKVVVSGSTGLVGSALVPFLTTGGHSVRRLVRGDAGGPDEIRWDPKGAAPDADELEGCDAVVHLAGENVGSGRWTDARMKEIRASRVAGTRLLCEALAKLETKPEVLVCASAVGFYGDRGDELLDEGSSRGSGFLTDVCQEWEEACEPARAAGIRVVNLRFGVILSPAGGALQRMLLPFKLGAGGRIGSGRQYMGWIALDDVVGVIHHALTHDGLRGPVNAVAPEPVTNAEYTKVLGKVLSRPTIAPMPAFAARLAFGRMADSLLLASARVVPRALQESGFRYDHPELEGALRHLLGRGSS